jgi:hypothetical protein
MICISFDQDLVENKYRKIISTPPKGGGYSCAGASAALNNSGSIFPG